MRRNVAALAVVMAFLVLACGGSVKGGDGSGGGLDLAGSGDLSGQDVRYGTDARDGSAEDAAGQDPAATGDEGTVEPGPGDPGGDPVADPGVSDTAGTDPAGTDPAAGDPAGSDPAKDPAGTDPGPGDEAAADDGGPAGDAPAGGCEGCGTGTVKGKTCAPNAKMAVPYVKVWIDTVDCEGNAVHVQDFSDEKGEYVLENVPCGLQTIKMQKGSFGNVFSRFVDQGMTTFVSSGEGCFPSTAAKIAVVTGDWDAIEHTLAKLKLKYDLIWGTTPGGTGDGPNATSPETIKFLTDSAKLMSYDVVFINCSDTGVMNMQDSGAEISANLKAFIAKGGSLYASDYGLPYIQQTWPGYVLGGAWSCGGWSKYPGAVVDLDLAGYIGKTTVNIEYGLGPLTCVDGVGPDTHVFIDSSKAISGCSGTEMMMSFQPEPGGGKVIYTTFHNDEQPATQTDMQTILEYTVFLM